MKIDCEILPVLSSHASGIVRKHKINHRYKVSLSASDIYLNQNYWDLFYSVLACLEVSPYKTTN